MAFCKPPHLRSPLQMQHSLRILDRALGLYHKAPIRARVPGAFVSTSSPHFFESCPFLLVPALLSVFQQFWPPPPPPPPTTPRAGGASAVL